MDPLRHSGVVVLAARDLKAREQVGSACAASGLELVLSSAERLKKALAAQRPTLVVLDLDEGGESLLATVAEAVASGSIPPASVIGYFSHVDVDLGRKATDLGLRAFPRGRFWRELRDLIAQAAQV